jgi:hypothetical protein
MIQGVSAMATKAASARVTAKVAAKSVRANGAKPRTKKARMSKLEAKRLEQFKALMKKYEGKLAFAGSDE